MLLGLFDSAFGWVCDVSCVALSYAVRSADSPSLFRHSAEHPLPGAKVWNCASVDESCVSNAFLAFNVARNGM